MKPLDKQWIRSADGGRIVLGNGDVSPWAIASGLAKVCRYGGQCTSSFYSVAQHCVLVAQHAPVELEREALMHDCAEGLGLGDVCRPWKREMARRAALRCDFDGVRGEPEISDYEAVSSRLERSIAEHYGLQFPWPDAVKDVDVRLVADEIRVLFENPAHQTEPGITGFGIKIEPIENWREARDLWLEAWFRAEARVKEREFWAALQVERSVT